MKKRIELTIETFQIVRLRKGTAVFDSCPFCAEETEMITPEFAAAISVFTTREIYRRIEAGAIHFLERRDGSLLVCLKSLAKMKHTEQ